LTRSKGCQYWLGGWFPAVWWRGKWQSRLLLHLLPMGVGCRYAGVTGCRYRTVLRLVATHVLRLPMSCYPCLVTHVLLPMGFGCSYACLRPLVLELSSYCVLIACFGNKTTALLVASLLVACFAVLVGLASCARGDIIKVEHGSSGKTGTLFTPLSHTRTPTA